MSMQFRLRAPHAQALWLLQVEPIDSDICEILCMFALETGLHRICDTNQCFSEITLVRFLCQSSYLFHLMDSCYSGLTTISCFLSTTETPCNVYCPQQGCFLPCFLSTAETASVPKAKVWPYYHSCRSYNYRGTHMIPGPCCRKGGACGSCTHRAAPHLPGVQ